LFFAFTYTTKERDIEKKMIKEKERTENESERENVKMIDR